MTKDEALKELADLAPRFSRWADGVLPEKDRLDTDEGIPCFIKLIYAGKLQLNGLPDDTAIRFVQAMTVLAST